ncbi:MAG: FAD-dependent oxidoreductase [Fuerstiella sp.]
MSQHFCSDSVTDIDMLTDLLGDKDHLIERARTRNAFPVHSNGEFVLYWMHVAVRAHENPALDTAVAIANRLQKPVLVYHALSERYQFASDRHHTFILQGAADVQQQFAERGIPYTFHLERHGHRGPWLKQLAEAASVVVTDEMPTNPMTSFVGRLAETVSVPIVAVDASCVVPMQLVGKAYQRAFEYRDATAAQYNLRVSAKWDDEQLQTPADKTPQLPFTSINFSTQSIAELVSQCDIDHTVGPVPDTHGGSTAGYQRWEEFKTNGLRAYAKRRNDPTKDGASRMSAYLHYGMVSPFRLARETVADGSPGSEKYSDELLIWRELSWAYCFHKPNHNLITAIPEWAMQTLQEHERDVRDVLYDWETLARAATNSSLWNAAQQSLLVHGELHNNVRMTWGKALLQWTPNATTAFKQIIDLNHRYALDGRDPSSYGGILWCLGQFDRPFKPAQPIIGTVRPRPIDQHDQRLNLKAYQQKTGRRLTGATSRRTRVAVIGAGLSGLICARTLQDHGLDVQVFDKGRAPAGRMSTRETRNGFFFDHGCQYFKVTDERFRRYVSSWEQQGLVAKWDVPIVRVADGVVQSLKADQARYVGIPGMNAVCRHLASAVLINRSIRVSAVSFDQTWTLVDDTGQHFSHFDHLVVATPAGQAADLLKGHSPICDRISQIEMKKSWTTLVALPQRTKWQNSAAVIDHSLLAWASENSSKPARTTAGDEQTWVLQANAEWSDKRFEDDPNEIAKIMLAEFEKIIGEQTAKPLYLKAHRWKFALADSESASVPPAERSLYDPEVALAVCGDWCCGHNVQAAFLSGSAAAGRILGTLEFTAPGPTTLF